MSRKQIYSIKRLSIGVFSGALKLICCLFFAFPFYWMIITSFKTYTESIQFPPSIWPAELTLEGYITVFQGLELGMYIKNSLIIIACIIVMQLLVMVPASYAFAKYKFRGQGPLFGLVMVAFMIPSQVTFVSVYIMFSRMGLIKTLVPQILPFGANAFGIFLLRQNFKQIPEELIESARLDEAGEIKIMTHIMLPMAKSTMVTIALLSFISHWNAYFWPLVMTTTESVKPFTLAIEKLKDLEYGTVWPTIMAGNVLMVLPVLILFLVGSKRIIAAMAYRGMK
ncbi:ABC transporter permease subunit [Clostridium sp. MCC353]|uniref:carbohydrate ABC transporter permease n=1 Tax=Clostridium sp. MCC353 TaxID=2592646 RepID=UPI001C0362E7|nr:carbohydrate ABC transporter permease [Clostridium sp. MCC353]MBT9777659.1 ABC transporter permease subunit [Clostridium sp. MCC353]